MFCRLRRKILCEEKALLPFQQEGEFFCEGCYLREGFLSQLLGLLSMGLLTGRGGRLSLTGVRETRGGHDARDGLLSKRGEQCLGGSRLHEELELPPMLLCMTIPAMTPKTPAAMYLPVLSSCLTICGGVSARAGEYSGVEGVSSEYPDASAMSALRCS